MISFISSSNMIRSDKHSNSPTKLSIPGNRVWRKLPSRIEDIDVSDIEDDDYRSPTPTRSYDVNYDEHEQNLRGNIIPLSAVSSSISSSNISWTPSNCNCNYQCPSDCPVHSDCSYRREVKKTKKEEHNIVKKRSPPTNQIHRPSGNRDKNKTFAFLLHGYLEAVEANLQEDIISWQPHGRCFLVHKPREFVSKIMPTLFRQTKWSSFQRQLNLYGFKRLTDGPDKGAYYHELFLRGKASLCEQIKRTKIKGTKVRVAGNPDLEPDFYSMPPIEPDPPKEENAEDKKAEGIESILPYETGNSNFLNSQRFAEYRLPSFPVMNTANSRSENSSNYQSFLNKSDQFDNNWLQSRDYSYEYQDNTTCKNNCEPKSSVISPSEVSNSSMSDDPVELKKIFDRLGKPLNLDDLDNLPQDDVGWGHLLENIVFEE